MSELINAATDRQHDFHRRLLGTVSATALAVALSAPVSGALAETNDRPTMWIELGGQLEAIQGADSVYAAPFVIRNLDLPLNSVSPTSVQRPPHHDFGGEGRIVFEPKNSDWVFTAGVRYGRSNAKRTLHQQTHTQFTAKTAKYGQTGILGTPPRFNHITKVVTRFNHSDTSNSQVYAVADFMAGRDVGLGLFGKGGSSVLSAGVRFAQFTRRSSVVFRSLPEQYYKSKVVGQVQTAGGHRFHSYYAHFEAERSSRGIGPAISWEGDTPIIGQPDAGELTFDWGANAAALFGRQKVTGSHQTTGRYFFGVNGAATSHYIRNIPIDRSHSVVIPNLGGFAGISFRLPNVKLSAGYRADFFLGAMDGGIDTRKTYDRNFYGPFTTVSIGLGG